MNAARQRANGRTARIRGFLQFSAAMVVMTLFSVPLLVVAVGSGFRKRRFYTKVMVKKLSQAILRLARVRVVVHQSEPLPAGPVFYMPNHPSMLDVFILTSLGLPNTRYFMKRWVQRFVPFAIIARVMGVFFTPPQTDAQLRIQLFQKAERQLQRTGESILGSPEGRISPDGLGRFNRGVFHLATNLGYPILPIYLDLPPEISTSHGFAAWPGTVHVYFLPAMPTNDWRIDSLDCNQERVRAIFAAFEKRITRAHETKSGASVSLSQLIPTLL